MPTQPKRRAAVCSRRAITATLPARPPQVRNRHCAMTLEPLGRSVQAEREVGGDCPERQDRGAQPGTLVLSIMSWSSCATLSMSKYSYWPARDSALSSPHRWTLSKSP
jgi:hypothetical protein